MRRKQNSEQPWVQFLKFYLDLIPILRFNSFCFCVLITNDEILWFSATENRCLVSLLSPSFLINWFKQGKTCILKRNTHNIRLKIWPDASKRTLGIIKCYVSLECNIGPVSLSCLFKIFKMALAEQTVEELVLGEHVLAQRSLAAIPNHISRCGLSLCFCYRLLCSKWIFTGQISSIDVTNRIHIIYVYVYTFTCIKSGIRLSVVSNCMLIWNTHSLQSFSTCRSHFTSVSHVCQTQVAVAHISAPLWLVLGRPSTCPALFLSARPLAAWRSLSSHLISWGTIETGMK